MRHCGNRKGREASLPGPRASRIRDNLRPASRSGRGPLRTMPPAPMPAPAPPDRPQTAMPAPAHADDRRHLRCLPEARCEPRDGYGVRNVATRGMVPGQALRGGDAGGPIASIAAIASCTVIRPRPVSRDIAPAVRVPCFIAARTFAIVSGVAGNKATGQDTLSVTLGLFGGSG